MWMFPQIIEQCVFLKDPQENMAFYIPSAYPIALIYWEQI